MIHVLFRTTEQKNKNKKEKIKSLTPLAALDNLFYQVSNSDDDPEVEIHVFGDRLSKDSEAEFKQSLHVDHYHKTKAHGNAETFLEILKYTADNFKPNDIVYFLEDDYIHDSGWNVALVEGLERGDYVSLYDHPDKYTGQPEMLFLTKNSHWKFTHSTTMTFACKVQTLLYDQHIFEAMIETGNPPDHQIFMHLTQNLHRRLATPIPALATHGETAWLAPCINWERILNED